MIVTIVTFPLPEGLTASDAEKLYTAGADAYRSVHGLLRKHYLFRPGTGGGVYVWGSRSDAEAFFTLEWCRFIEGKYGKPPTIDWFESPVAVVNAA